MKLHLSRTHDNGQATFGQLSADGEFLCYVLEDVVRETDAPVASWKIRGHTAIASTSHPSMADLLGYRITLENSPRFGADTLTVNAVPGFLGVRMHAGNDHDDTEGCPLLGMQINATGIVGGTSRPAVQLVKDKVREAIRAGQQVWLTISNVTETA